MAIRLESLGDLSKLRERESRSDQMDPASLVGFDFDILLLWLFILNIITKGSKAVAEKSARLTLKELPFFNYTGNLIQIDGQFNNSLSTFCKTKRDLDKLTCLYDLDLFTLNTVL